MSKLAFGVNLGSVTLTIMALIFSWRFPEARIWPPKHEKSGGQAIMLILFSTAALSLILLGIFDGGSYIIPRGLRFLGFVLGIVGNLMALWAMVTLGIGSTAGKEDRLVRAGPYRYSRNPQYVGFIIGLVGWGFLANSLLTLVASLFSIIPLVLVPFVEEPWLQIKYGLAYNQYRLETPRFLSWRR